MAELKGCVCSDGCHSCAPGSREHGHQAAHLPSPTAKCPAWCKGAPQTFLAQRQEWTDATGPRLLGDEKMGQKNMVGPS